MAPWSSTFLSLTSTSFIFHSLFLGFLPLYLLIISCDDCFEDCTTKYRNILISKWGKKDYVITNIAKSFCISFFLILFTLLLNMLMSEIIFNTATYSIFSENLVDEDKTSLFYIEATHPTVTNIIYIFITSFIAAPIVNTTKIPRVMTNTGIFVSKPYSQNGCNASIMDLSVCAGKNHKRKSKG